jgi:hypothetical protein
MRVEHQLERPLCLGAMLRTEPDQHDPTGAVLNRYAQARSPTSVKEVPVGYRYTEIVDEPSASLRVEP